MTIDSGLIAPPSHFRDSMKQYQFMYLVLETAMDFPVRWQRHDDKLILSLRKSNETKLADMGLAIQKLTEAGLSLLDENEWGWLFVVSIDPEPKLDVMQPETGISEMQEWKQKLLREYFRGT